MKRRLFGTDGIRGIANQAPMTAEMALALGRAVAFYAQNGSYRHRIVIGKDTRLSGYMLEMAFASGVCSMGVDALMVGPLPTPALAFLTQSMRADAGIMISASHNPYEDNGIKIFGRDGFKLPDATEALIEAYLVDSNVEQIRPTKDAVGKAFRIDDAMGRYIVHLKQAVPAGLDLNGMRVVVDCAHGAAYRLAPIVLTELGAEVISIAVSPDGRNINDGCGATNPELLGQVVRDEGAAVGLALDGDADRLVVADEYGRVLHGDAVLAMGARSLKQDGLLRNDTFVATVMSNLALDTAAASFGTKVLRTQVGDRYVVQEMRRSELAYGGEQSGHLVYLEHGTTGDGMVAGLKVLDAIVREGAPLSEMAEIIEPLPQALVSVRVAKKRPIESLDGVMAAIQRIESHLADDGRVIVRYSGTEPKARVLVEGPVSEDVDTWAQEIASELRNATD